MVRRLGITAILGILLVSAGAVRATEMGGGAYPNGAEGIKAGAVPPPGTYFLNYTRYYSATKFADKNGDKLIPDFRADAVANVFRVLYVSDKKILNASWAAHIFVPVVNLNARAFGATGSKTGIGDIIVDPFILAWHSKNWHQAAGVDMYLPTGEYSSTSVANIGRHYWTFEPIYAVTFLSDNGWEVSSKFMYDFNTENEATRYSSGQEFHFDYFLGKKIDKFDLGLSGYYYQQVTNDEQNGAKVGDGFKGRVFAIGPEIGCTLTKKASLIFKYQREMAAQYRPEGNNFWLKFIYRF